MKRLFLAVNLPQEVKDQVAAVQAQVKKQMKRSDVAWVAPDNFHVTLHFLGDVDDEHQSVLVATLGEKEYPQPFMLRLLEIAAFPNKKDPKTIFVETTVHPSLIGLRKRIADVLVQHGFEIDGRKWTSHITLGRVKKRAEVLQPEKIDVEKLEFDVESFELMSSTLTSTGSQYHKEYSFEL